MHEKWQRTALLIGEKTVSKLQNTHIALFGLGAVGSFVLEFLLRCGAEKITLIDFDTISITNFNRLLLATDSALGKAKVDVAQTRAHSINSQAQIQAISMFAGNENIDDFLEKNQFDIIIDAIDSLNPKTSLLEIALRRQETIFSSMGAAGRTDPSLVRCGDLWQSKHCSLAAKIRRGLRKRGIEQPLPVVYSEELAQKPRSIHEEMESEKEAYFERGRRRSIQPSIVYIPAVFAAFLVEMVLKTLQ